MVIHRRTGCTAQNALQPLVAVLACVALLAAGCSSGGGLKAGDAATFVEGFVGDVAVDGQDWKAGADGESIPDGARVRATDHEVRLALRDGVARLAPGAAATVTEQAVQLERGDLLLDSNGALQAKLGDTIISTGGMVRLSSGMAAHVAVYEGSATVSRPAQQRDVPALRQLDLTAFRLAPAGEPLRYHAADPWDQELLAEAIAFDGEVARLARGMEIEFGTRPQPPAFYREFAGPRAVPVLSRTAPVSRGRAFGPPSDVLLTMFFAQTVVAGRLTDTIRKVAHLRAAGARWGLIAVEFDVASDALVAAVDGLDSERLALAERAPASAQGTGALVSASAGRDGNAAAQTSSPGGATTSPSGPTTGSGSTDQPRDKGGDGPKDGDGDPPPQEEEPTPVEKVVSDVVGTVEDNRPPDDDSDSSAPLRKMLPLPQGLPAQEGKSTR
jgi:hypothetical protein